jgi:hypothetical protein
MLAMAGHVLTGRAFLEARAFLPSPLTDDVGSRDYHASLKPFVLRRVTASTTSSIYLAIFRPSHQ